MPIYITIRSEKLQRVSWVRNENKKKSGLENCLQILMLCEGWGSESPTPLSLLGKWLREVYSREKVIYEEGLIRNKSGRALLGPCLVILKLN